jgi:phosphoribosylglycinamide formyltransferase 1
VRASVSTARGKVLLLAGPDTSSRVVYNALRRTFTDVSAIVEDRPSRSLLLRRRLRSLGHSRVLGQLVFVAAVRPILSVLSRRRVAEIVHNAGLDMTPIPSGNCHWVESVNSAACIALMQKFRPDVVAVCGTRILSAEVLGSVTCKFVNIHAGLTPWYRGVHGGYWALYEGAPDCVGTTIHLIDQGIDTGPVLAQVRFSVDATDSFVTYPYLHVAYGMNALVDVVQAILAGDPIITSVSTAEGTTLRSHPTAWQYMIGLIRGIR